MGTQRNTIVILAIVATIIIVLFIALRKLDLFKALGLDKAQESFNKWYDDTTKGFNDWVSGLGDFLSGFNPDGLSGKTIDTSDAFGEGSSITFGEGTKIDKEGRIDAPNGVDLDLSPDDKRLVENFFDRQAKITANTQKLIDKNNLTRDEVAQINKLATDFVRLNVTEGAPRDSFGLIDAAFTAPAITARATNAFLNNKRGAFRDKKTGKKVSFGGFDSALAQEKALRDALAKSRKDNPEFFKRLDELRNNTLKGTVKKKQ